MKLRSIARDLVAKFKELVYRNHGLPSKTITDRDRLFDKTLESTVQLT